ncbi:MAG: DUF3369 domain-containing protein [Deltaproteobacteria bacterium]|nr:DUF3369 domain-containing protein [Deltaproteobacteria bacterium]
MARKYKQIGESIASILLIDDNLEYLEATRMLLQREGYSITTVASCLSALDIVTKNYFDLILVDYYMPNFTGEEFIKELRTFNKTVQVILQTGYASENPPRELLRKLDIQGFFDKSEGPSKLLFYIDIGIKAARTIQLAQKSKEGLSYILNNAPDLYRLQSFDELMQSILTHLINLLKMSNTLSIIFMNNQLSEIKDSNYKKIDAFIAIADEQYGYTVKIGAGRFSQKGPVSLYFKHDEMDLVNEAFISGNVLLSSNLCTFIPLKTKDSRVGFVYLEHEISNEEDKDLLKLFANQVAIAINNAKIS